MEKTGHYHKALEQYMQDLDITVYLMAVQERPKGIRKTDKWDALNLGNHLYNQLEKGIQVANKLHVVRRVHPPTPTAAALRGILRHRAELIRETTQRKNKLTAICDELFPEFTQVFKDPNGTTALRVRLQFPTPHALALASLHDIHHVRIRTYPSNAQVMKLQQLAAQSIGTNDVVRQRSLVLEQTQLIKELALMQSHIAVLDEEIGAIMTTSRDGRIVMSVPGWGAVSAATLIAGIGHIENFPSAAAFKAYCGWAPQVAQSGTTLDQATLTRGGARLIKNTVFLVVFVALARDCEWTRLYERLVPRKCVFDERTRTYKGKMKVVGRVAGQMLSLIYGLLKRDAEVLQSTPGGQVPPEPLMYDPVIHRMHREGLYRSTKPHPRRGTMTYVPKET
jgi:transposase